jgi:hypothetical protein
LVLSFSRAAVAEIRDRLGRASDDLAYVRVQTFDSFATYLLSMAKPEGEWRDKDYDGRIREAVRIIRGSEETSGVFSRFKHILIDEIQDLVGDRLELVMALLERHRGGVTVFGDPNQGIYRFSSRDADGPEREDIFSWLRRAFADGLCECAFTQDLRTMDCRARPVGLPTPRSDGREKNSADTILVELRTAVRRLRSMGSLPVQRSRLRRDDMSTVMLCRTNGEALWVARDLCDNGVPIVLQRRAVDRTVPSWVAVILGGQVGARVSKNWLFHRADDLLGDTFDADRAWTMLRRLGESVSSGVDLNTIRERIHLGYVPDELFEQRGDALTVSTVHRAKGREWDRVVVCAWEKNAPLTDSDPLEEAHVLYVALTRARREICRLEVDWPHGLFCHKRTRRWIRVMGRKTVVDLEVRGSDVCAERPFHVPGGESAEEVQHYLAHGVRPGDPVALHISASGSGAKAGLRYMIVHGDRVVGVASPHFVEEAYAVLEMNGSRAVRWPACIDGLRIEEVDTVAGTPATTAKVGLGPTGLWLRARVSGLGNLVFEVSSGERGTI